LRMTLRVMNFLPYQHQHIVMVTLRALHPHIVIGDHDEIQPGLRRGPRDLIVIPRPIGIRRVHVKVAGNFVCHSFFKHSERNEV
jgi:hypothetical protein